VLLVLLFYGWFGGVIEFLDLILCFVGVGYDVIVLLLLGFGFFDVLLWLFNVVGVLDCL